MLRLNSTVPKWDPDTKTWIYRPYIDGVQKKYTSRKPGPPGAAECKRKYNIALGKTQDRSQTRFQIALKEFLDDIIANHGIDSETYRNAESICRTHLLPRLKHKRCGDITDQDWQDCISKAKPVSDKQTELSRKTLANIRGAITLFCRFAKKARMISSKPDDLYIPKKAPVRGKLVIQPEVLADFLFDDDDITWMYLRAWQLMVVTGLRPGECYGLKKADVSGSAIYVSRSIRRDAKITSGKNANAQRALVKTKIASRYINAQLNRNLDSEWLFPDPDGAQPRPIVISHHWEDYRAKFPYRVTLYGLRHTFVSLTHTRIPKPLMQLLVGHAAATDTSGIYGHIIDGDDVLAAKMVDEVFDNLLKTSTKQVLIDSENP